MAFNVTEFRNHFSKYNEFAKSDKFEVWITIPSAISDTTFQTKELAFQCEAAELPGKDINMIEYRHYGFIQRIPHYINYPQVSLTFYCNGALEERKFFDRWFNAMLPTSTGLVNYYAEENGVPNYATNVTIRQYSMIGVDDPNDIPEVKVEEGKTLDRRLLDAVVNKVVNTAVDKYLGPIGQFAQYGDQLKKAKQQPVTKSQPKVIYECVLEDAMPISMSSMPLNWGDDSIHRLQVTFAYKKWKSTAEDQFVPTPLDNNYGDGDTENSKDNRVKDVLEQTIMNVANKFINKKIRL